MNELKIIGRKDIIDLPELGLTDLVAKIDTGAYGNALHCQHAEIVEVEGQQVLRFQLLDSNHPSFQDQTFEVKDFECKEVKSSSGVKEMRYVIRTRMRLFGKLYRTKFSLTNREEMRNPVLIGRKFLSNRFLVDVKKENLSYMSKNPSS